VQGREPFRITAVESDDPRLAFSAGDEPNSVHLVTVTFTADSEPGQVSNTVRIATDAGTDGNLEAIVQAMIAPVHADRSPPQR